MFWLHKPEHDHHCTCRTLCCCQNLILEEIESGLLVGKCQTRLRWLNDVDSVQCIDEDKTVIVVEGGQPASVKYRLVVPRSQLCPNNTHDLCRVHIDYQPQDHSPPPSVPSILMMGRV